MKWPRKTLRSSIRLGICVLLVILAACQAVSSTTSSPTPKPPTETATSAPTETPTSTLTPTPSLLFRLSGEELPDMEIGEPGESPTNRLRPQIGITRQTLDTEHFRIHYALEGFNHPPLKDKDNNGHPDYVEEVARAVEYVWESEIDYFGWPAPPPDGGLGGDDRYDVYLQDLESDYLLGYAAEDEESEYGNNPNTPAEERFAKASFFVIENDHFPIESMYNTVAHEFMHSIQFGIDASESQEWLWESTAAWMEEEVFDSVNDPLDWLPSVFKSPDSCQNSRGGNQRVEDYGHWYGMWIYMRFLSERYGHAAVRGFWELTSEQDDFQAWETLFEIYDTSIEHVFREYSIALLLRDFEEGRTYPTVRLEAIAYENEPFTPVDGVSQLGADYVEISGSGMLIVQLESETLEGILVGLNNDLASIFSMESNQTSVDSDAFEQLYLIVVNTKKAKGQLNCHTTDYSVSVTSGGGPQEPKELRSAENFSLPYVEGLLNYSDYFPE